MSNEESIATFYFSLPGLRADEERVPLGEMVLFQPTYEEWRSIEKTDVADLGLAAAMLQHFGLEKGLVRREQNGRVHYEYAEGSSQPAPVPWCLGMTRPWREGDGLEALETILPQVEASAIDCVLALRLNRSDEFLDFIYAGRFVALPGGQIARLPGIYRQAQPEMGERTYRVRREDLRKLNQLVALCRSYREAGGDGAGDLALEHWRLSFGINLVDTDRLALLFSALEAVLGGFRETKGSLLGSMPARAAFATGLPIKDYLDGSGRKLRNDVAHGRPPATSLTEDVRLIRSIIQQTLKVYLRFCVKVHDDRAAIAAALGCPIDEPTARLFNVGLGRARTGDSSAGEFVGRQDGEVEAARP